MAGGDDGAAPEAQEGAPAGEAAPDVPGGDGAAAPLEGHAADVAAGYTHEGASLPLGALLVDGDPEPLAQVAIPLRMLNRHGLVAGATGTGKTRTLQLMAEGLSAAGVPVFLTDIKGDLTGLAEPGTSSEKLLARTGPLGQDWSRKRSRSSSSASAARAAGFPSAPPSPTSARCCCPRCSA